MKLNKNEVFHFRVTLKNPMAFNIVSHKQKLILLLSFVDLHRLSSVLLNVTGLNFVFNYIGSEQVYA